ncbi:TPA: HNH endonuclease [Citrobacter amalonaticus]|uniref:HNH endonuclease n=1 Tax=Citrobacter TaxID=544 RepID=UPI0010C954B7|nr:MULTISPECIES: HNH endonuclease [Citrobacter]MCM7547644.1 HNH endonuclease [Enterobacter hormaechei]TKU90683.1 HNH endonuclease [Citrobacter sp. wls617]HAU4370686.1 HNH endonuclease [Citrobacter amalonaticus]MDL4455951.1 HNH endonuclease domain-containing protein [Citrobacter youngae]QMI04219.1 HNH endonuclease [Citrobacter sp. RHB25-C09]
MPLNCIVYEGEDLETYRDYNALPNDNKDGRIWDSEERNICRIKKSIKDYYIIAQDYTCPYCKQRIEVDHNGAWDAEHIIPKSSHPGFVFEPLNLCVSCKDCNNEKRDKTVLENNNRRTLPIRSGDYIIVHPHFDDYDEHIKVIEVAGYYIPRTDKGRKTIEKCGLLRFAYKYANYGGTSQENKETILTLANGLLDANTPADEHAFLGVISDAVETGKKLSKTAFLQQFGVRE